MPNIAVLRQGTGAAGANISPHLTSPIPPPTTGRVALVSQQPHLFAGSIADNIRLGPNKNDSLPG